MVNESLLNYIEGVKRKGFSDAEIKIELYRVGWTEKDVKEAFLTVQNKNEVKAPFVSSSEPVNLEEKPINPVNIEQNYVAEPAKISQQSNPTNNLSNNPINNSNQPATIITPDFSGASTHDISPIQPIKSEIKIEENKNPASQPSPIAVHHKSYKALFFAVFFVIILSCGVLFKVFYLDGKRFNINNSVFPASALRAKNYDVEINIDMTNGNGIFIKSENKTNLFLTIKGKAESDGDRLLNFKGTLDAVYSTSETIPIRFSVTKNNDAWQVYPIDLLPENGILPKYLKSIYPRNVNIDADLLNKYLINSLGISTEDFSVIEKSILSVIGGNEPNISSVTDFSSDSSGYFGSLEFDLNIGNVKVSIKSKENPSSKIANNLSGKYIDGKVFFDNLQKNISQQIITDKLMELKVSFKPNTKYCSSDIFSQNSTIVFGDGSVVNVSCKEKGRDFVLYADNLENKFLCIDSRNKISNISSEPKSLVCK